MEKCPICLDDIYLGDDYILSSCKHIFCKKCISEWKLGNTTCPLCRSSMTPNVSSSLTPQNRYLVPQSPSPSLTPYGTPFPSFRSRLNNIDENDDDDYYYRQLLSNHLHF